MIRIVQTCSLAIVSLSLLAHPAQSQRAPSQTTRSQAPRPQVSRWQTTPPRPSPRRAAAPGTVQIAVVQSQAAAPFRALLAGFKRGMRHKRIAVEYTLYQLQRDGNLPASLFKRGTGKDPRLIFALGPHAARAASAQIHNLPIVAGLIRQRDGTNSMSNVTGVLFDYPVEIQLSWMKRLLPNNKNVGVLFNPDENEDRIESAAGVASKLGLNLMAHEVLKPKDLPKAMRDLSKGADLIWGLADRTTMTRQTARKFIVFSFQNRIPLSGASTSWVKSGALFSLERDYEDIGAQCAEIAARVMNGVSPASLRPEPPRRLLYSINLKTARYMRLKLPDHVVQDAAYVFE